MAGSRLVHVWSFRNTRKPETQTWRLHVQKNHNSSLYLTFIFSPKDLFEAAGLYYIHPAAALFAPAYTPSDQLPSRLCVFVYVLNLSSSKGRLCARTTLTRSCKIAAHQNEQRQSITDSVSLQCQHDHPWQDPEFSRYQHKTAVYKTDYGTIGDLILIWVALRAQTVVQ